MSNGPGSGTCHPTTSPIRNDSHPAEHFQRRFHQHGRRRWPTVLPPSEIPITPRRGTSPPRPPSACRYSYRRDKGPRPGRCPSGRQSPRPRGDRASGALPGSRLGRRGNAIRQQSRDAQLRELVRLVREHGHGNSPAAKLGNSSGMPGYGRVLSAQRLAYSCRASSMPRASNPWSSGSCPIARRIRFSNPSPTNSLYASTGCPGSPNCARAAFVASARSSSVFSRVPSRSNSTALQSMCSDPLPRKPSSNQLCEPRYDALRRNALNGRSAAT